MRSTLSPKRRLAVAGITTLCMMAVAVPAAAQTGGSGPPGRTTTHDHSDGSRRPSRPREAAQGRHRRRARGRSRQHPGGDRGRQCDPHPPLRLGRWPQELHRHRLRLLGRGELRPARRRPAGEPDALRASGEQLGRSGQGSLDHGLREREPRLHDRRGPAVRHLLRRRSLEPGQRSALAQEEAQAGGLHRPSTTPATRHRPKPRDSQPSKAGCPSHARKDCPTRPRDAGSGSDIPRPRRGRVVRCAQRTPGQAAKEETAVASTQAATIEEERGASRRGRRRPPGRSEQALRRGRGGRRRSTSR